MGVIARNWSDVSRISVTNRLAVSNYDIDKDLASYGGQTGNGILNIPKVSEL